MQKNSLNTQQMVLYALGMATVFVTTVYIRIPNGIDGYFNLGDGFILLFASIVNPFGAFFIGGLGSALADVAGGYAYYFFPTLLIKGLEGFIVAYLFQRYTSKVKCVAYALGAFIMVTGYFFTKWFLKGSLLIALSGIPENILQSAIGYAIAIVALPIIMRSFQQMHHQKSMTKANEE